MNQLRLHGDHALVLAIKELIYSNQLQNKNLICSSGAEMQHMLINLLPFYRMMKMVLCQLNIFKNNSEKLSLIIRITKSYNSKALK